MNTQQARAIARIQTYASVTHLFLRRKKGPGQPDPWEETRNDDSLAVFETNDRGIISARKDVIDQSCGSQNGTIESFAQRDTWMCISHAAANTPRREENDGASWPSPPTCTMLVVDALHMCSSTTESHVLIIQLHRSFLGGQIRSSHTFSGFENFNTRSIRTPSISSFVNTFTSGKHMR